MTINVGIAGLGKMGNAYLSVLSKNPYFNVECIYDIDESRLEDNNTNCLKFSSLDEFVNADFELGIVASLTGTHSSIAVPLLKSGKYVLVESPIDDDLRKADEIILTAEENNKSLMISSIDYFNPITSLITKNISKIGSITRIGLIRKRPALDNDCFVGSNVLLDYLVHDVYNLTTWLDGTPLVIQAKEVKRSNYHMPYFDEGKGELCIGDTSVTFEASWASQKFQRTAIIRGSDGSIFADYLNDVVKISVLDKKRDIVRPYKAKFSFQKLLDAVYNTVEQGRDFPINIEKCRHSLEICLKVENIAELERTANQNY